MGANWSLIQAKENWGRETIERALCSKCHKGVWEAIKARVDELAEEKNGSIITQMRGRENVGKQAGVNQKRNRSWEGDREAENAIITGKGENHRGGKEMNFVRGIWWH